MKRFFVLTAVLVVFSMLVSCGSGSKTENDSDNSNDDGDTEQSDDDEEDDGDIDLTGSVFSMPKMNPSGNIPLSAEIPMKSEGIAKVAVKVADKEKDKEPFSREYTVAKDAAETVKIPVLGLFAAYKNKVTVTATDESSKTVDEKTFTLKTGDLPKDFPAITMTGKINSGWTMVNWLRTPRSRTEMNGIALDEQGRVRWYSDLPFPVCFPIVVKDDTFYCGGGEAESHVTKYNFMGYVLEDIDVAPLGYKNVHHEVFIKPDGNYLIGVDKAGSEYIEDRAIEINPNDPENPQLRHVWNLNDTLPDLADLFMDMQPTSPEIPGQTNNPIHHNAIFYDESDDTIIVGSQTAGIIKLTMSGYLKWYLAPHLFGLIDDADGDGKSDSFTEKYDPANQLTWVGDYSQKNDDGTVVAGENYVNERAPINGIPYKVYSEFEFKYPEFFLTPLDKNGNEIEDLSVKQGLMPHEDFAWPFRAHNPTILKNGNLMLFDNGLARNFEFPPISQNHYSRVVEYKIVPDKDGYGGTIQQIWEYVLNDDPMWYSMSLIVSGANELENGNRLITSGSLGSSFIPEMFRKQYGDGPTGAFIVEIDPKDNSEKNRITLDRYIDDDYPVNEFSAFRAYRFEISAKLK